MLHSLAEFYRVSRVGREGGRVWVAGCGPRLSGWLKHSNCQITLNSQLFSVFKFLLSSDDKKGVDRASTVIARDVNEGMLTWH